MQSTLRAVSTSSVSSAKRSRALGLQSALSPLAGKRLTVWGAAFKAGTDDIRDSPALDVACRLHVLGAQVTVYDPMATGNALASFPELAYADSAVEAASGAEVVLVLTTWPEFAGISPVATGAVVASMTVVDACQGIDGTAWQQAGWNVLSLTGGHTECLENEQPECVAAGPVLRGAR